MVKLIENGETSLWYSKTTVRSNIYLNIRNVGLIQDNITPFEVQQDSGTPQLELLAAMDLLQLNSGFIS